MRELAIKLPAPQYRLGDFYQWEIPREEFFAWGPQLFPHIRWSGRGQSDPKEEQHWGHLEALSFERKLQLLESCPHTVLFDWCRFTSEGHFGQEWEPFFRFSLPLLPQVSLFSDRVILRHLGGPLEYWSWPAFGEVINFHTPPIAQDSLVEEQVPHYGGWEEAFSLLQGELASSGLQKVVLARKKIMYFAHPLDGDGLWQKPPSFPDSSYRIMICPDRDHCFYSLTPERLFKHQGNQCHTEALAGSARGIGSLLDSEKDRYEHELVVEGIVEDMEDLTCNYQRGKTQVIDLAYIQHLKTPLTFTLRKGVGPLSIRDALHPTAALGGRPREQALEFLQEYEPFDRGLYGAPIGRWSADTQEYAVGIRSALSVGRELHVFAGAGIVPQSQVLSEWRETENKMESLL